MSLRERPAYLKGPKKQTHTIPQAGDVVLIKENLPRGRWKVGIIHELVRGRDGLIRSAKLLISPKNYLHRALSLLYPIECPRESSTQPNHSETSEQRQSNGHKGNVDVYIPPDMDVPPDGKESDQPSNTEDDLVVETSIDMTRNNVMKRPTRQSTLKAR